MVSARHKHLQQKETESQQQSIVQQLQHASRPGFFHGSLSVGFLITDSWRFCCRRESFRNGSASWLPYHPASGILLLNKIPLLRDYSVKKNEFLVGGDESTTTRP
jgi:hypothetical protein